MAWGLFFGIMLMIEKWVPGLQKLPDLLRHVYVLIAVIFSFVLFNADSFAMALGDFAGLLGLANVPAVTPASVYYLKSYGVLFCAGILGSTPVVKRAGERILESKWAAVLEPLFLGAMLLVCTAYLVDGSFSPFLYFRF